MKIIKLIERSAMVIIGIIGLVVAILTIMKIINLIKSYEGLHLLVF